MLTQIVSFLHTNMKEGGLVVSVLDRGSLVSVWAVSNNPRAIHEAASLIRADWPIVGGELTTDTISADPFRIKYTEIK